MLDSCGQSHSCGKAPELQDYPRTRPQNSGIWDTPACGFDGRTDGHVHEKVICDIAVFPFRSYFRQLVLFDLIIGISVGFPSYLCISASSCRPVLLFLHRGFFAQAMSDDPVNPLRSPYSPSVLAAYSSACTVLDDTRSQFLKKPLLCARVWRIWSFAFSAAVSCSVFCLYRFTNSFVRSSSGLLRSVEFILISIPQLLSNFTLHLPPLGVRRKPAVEQPGHW